MLVYWLVWVWIICATVFFKHSDIRKLLFVMTMFFIFLFIGFRYEVGGDWGNYLVIYERYAFEEFTDVLLSKEFGYHILNYIGNILGYEDTIFVNVICAALVILFLYFAAMSLKEYWMVLLCYFPYHLLVVSNGYTRQSVAIAISLFSFCFLIKNRVLLFLLFLLIASCFHTSASVLVIFALMPFFIRYKKVFLFEFYSACIFLFLPFLLYFFQSFSENMYLQNEVSSKGVFLRWSSHIIPLLVYYKVRRHIQEFTDRKIMDFFCILIFLVLLIAFFFSTISDRLNLYLIFFDLYVLSRAISIFSIQQRKLLIASLILYYTSFIGLWLFLGDWASSWIPYSNYITNYIMGIF